MPKKAVVLLSGGIDSSTTLFLAKKNGYDCSALIFDYGQRHKKELAAAKKIARKADCGAHVVRLRLLHRGSALLNKNSPLARPKDIRRIKERIPDTYVPARNTIFLSFASSLAEALGAQAIFIGVNAVDYSGYPDCRPGYLALFNRLLRCGTRAGVSGKKIKVLAPLLYKTKKDIIRLGTRLGVPYELTWSCYAGNRYACGTCDSCFLRKMGFRQAGLTDPVKYKKAE